LPLRANDGSGSTYWLPVVRIRPNLRQTTHNEQPTTRLLLNGCLKARNYKLDGQIFGFAPHGTPT
jgi:hypothetical protein